MNLKNAIRPLVEKQPGPVPDPEYSKDMHALICAAFRAQRVYDNCKGASK